MTAHIHAWISVYYGGHRCISCGAHRVEPIERAWAA